MRYFGCLCSINEEVYRVTTQWKKEENLLFGGPFWKSRPVRKKVHYLWPNVLGELLRPSLHLRLWPRSWVLGRNAHKWSPKSRLKDPTKPSLQPFLLLLLRALISRKNLTRVFSCNCFAAKKIFKKNRNFFTKSTPRQPTPDISNN